MPVSTFPLDRSGKPIPPPPIWVAEAGPARRVRPVIPEIDISTGVAEAALLAAGLGDIGGPRRRKVASLWVKMLDLGRTNDTATLQAILNRVEPSVDVSRQQLQLAVDNLAENISGV